MTARHVISIADLDGDTLVRLVNAATAIGRGEWAEKRPLAGKVVGIYFRKTSTRTRTSFTVGAMKLGGSVIAYGPNDLQIVTGETIEDTARVLSNYLDVLVIRTNETVAEMKALAAQNRMPIVNAMSEAEHPTQAVTDLAALQEHFGRLEGLHMLFIGEGNNTAASLALAFARIPGMHLTLVTPEGYGVARDVLEMAQEDCRKSGSTVEEHHRMDALPKGVDAVYTTRWLTMGVQKKDADWLPLFRPYTVTPQVMAEVS
ncbi:MAG TPA: ornithine carbamoyltransferase, partial [Thermoanaerobaculia bacterium]